jgi:ferritin-like protein
MIRASALRLAGPSEPLIRDAVGRFLADAERHAGMLAGRFAHLGGDIPGDLSRFAAFAPSCSGDAPDPNDSAAFVGFVLEQERAAVRFYAAFLNGIRDKDQVTWFEVFGILKYHVEMEDEI